MTPQSPDPIRKANLIPPREWMPADPEVADVATWGQNPVPMYVSDFPPDEQEEMMKEYDANYAKMMKSADQPEEETPEEEAAAGEEPDGGDGSATTIRRDS